MSDKKSQPVNIKNRKATFEYAILEKYVAGIILKGTEIKSVRAGKANINEAYCYLNRKNEIIIKGMHIAEYGHSAAFFNHEPIRERKLLLNFREIEKIKKNLTSGITMIPLRLFISERGYAKIEIALAKGKKLHDKRQSIKERDTKKELDRVKRARG